MLKNKQDFGPAVTAALWHPGCGAFMEEADEVCRLWLVSGVHLSPT